MSSSFGYWATGVVASAFLIIFAMIFFYERRQRLWYSAFNHEDFLYCNRCGHLFRSPTEAQECACPKCTNSQVIKL